MKYILNQIKKFIITTVIEDLKQNGRLFQFLTKESETIKRFTRHFS